MTLFVINLSLYNQRKSVTVHTYWFELTLIKLIKSGKYALLVVNLKKDFWV
jgi:hypothetical protein